MTASLPASCTLPTALIAALEDGTLPPNLPLGDPLDLLVALHQEVTQAALSDLEHAQRVADLARQVACCFPEDPIVQAQAHWTQGNAILYVPNYLHALEHYDWALAWYERACKLLESPPAARDIRVVQIPRVFCLSELGRYREALQAVELAEQWLHNHPNDIAELTLLLNRSQLAGMMGEYAQMVDLADATIALAERLGIVSRIAHGWINRAWACIYLGRFTEAADAIERGIAAATAAGETLTIGRALSNRAMLLRCQGQLFAALTTLQEAEHLRVQASGEQAILAWDKACIYEQLLQLPDAQRAAHRAADQFAQQGQPAYSASAALDAARIAVQRRQARSAQKLLSFARAQAEQASLRPLYAELALTEAALATLPAPAVGPRKLTGLRRRACVAAQEAVALLDASGLTQEAAQGLLTVAELHAQLGDTAEAIAIYRGLLYDQNRQIQLMAHAGLGRLLGPAEALVHLQRAAELTVERRRSLPMEELQARYSSESSIHHTQLVACYLTLGQVQQALESVWAAKAGPLLDLRSAATTVDAGTLALFESAKAGIQRWREQERAHRRKAMDALQREQYERADYHTQRVRAAAAEAQHSELALTRALRTLGGRDGQAAIPTLGEVQSALTPGTALLEYSECGDELLCFLIQPDRPPIYRNLGACQALIPLLERWMLMDGAVPAGADQYREAVLAPLWETLLAPWQQALATTTTLLIAPCGLLYHVPWAALWNRAAYLRDELTILLTPSGAMWAAPWSLATPPPGPPRLLSYAGSGKRQLAYVTAEIAAIARHLPDTQVSLEATAADLRAEPAPRLLHIAAHGYTNANVPVCSTLELADGPFLLLEAHRLNLRGTQLVVLSACETSVRPDYGDMALVLAGAFLCAGAQYVLASLWSVSDAATAALMERFYAAFAAGAAPAEALREAQRQLAHTHPLDWAAFQVWIGAR